MKELNKPSFEQKMKHQIDIIKKNKIENYLEQNLRILYESEQRYYKELGKNINLVPPKMTCKIHNTEIKYYDGFGVICLNCEGIYDKFE